MSVVKSHSLTLAARPMRLPAGAGSELAPRSEGEPHAYGKSSSPVAVGLGGRCLGCLRSRVGAGRRSRRRLGRAPPDRRRPSALQPAGAVRQERAGIDGAGREVEDHRRRGGGALQPPGRAVPSRAGRTPPARQRHPLPVGPPLQRHRRRHPRRQGARLRVRHPPLDPPQRRLHGEGGPERHREVQ